MTPSAARIAAVLLAAAIAAGAGEAAARSCAVTAVSGEDARWWRDGSWRPLEAGPLPSAEVILATGPDSRAEIRCDDGTTVTLGTDSEISLGSLLAPEPDRGVAMQLLQGVAGVVASAGDWMSFELRAPLAIASVRSTAWLVRHDEAEGTAAFVREGEVRVRPLVPGDPVTLRAGDGIDVPPGGPPGEVVQWGAPRVEALGARLGHSWQ